MDIKLSSLSLDVTHLLISAVHADAVMERREINVIIDALETLDIQTKDEQRVTRVELLRWLDMNYEDISERYSGSKREIEWVILLSRMARRDDLTAIAQTVADVCRTDDRIDGNEKQLLEMIVKFWN